MTEALSQRPEFRRMLAVSLVAHGVFCLMLLFAPGPRVRIPDGVLSVSLVAAPARPSRPAPEQALPPAAAPEPVARSSVGYIVASLALRLYQLNVNKPAPGGVEMAIRPNDPFDVLRHFILGSYPDGFLSPDSHLELTQALETVQERLERAERLASAATVETVR